ncbi:hypothetical protein [Microvirga rosea]|uniref:hypothetical protein n=1 Tax=Microvirga rosea TaxID=2715425 RepID=UPI001D0AC607|nr:hypothetical protein [Microvirga rosea]MCB8820516.1 hypothetical protein [Microvirga rosea]
MQVATRIDHEDFVFSIWRGTIHDVHAARQSHNTGSVEIGVQDDEGARRSIIVKPLIFTKPGDKLSLVFARRAGIRSGVLVGLVNHSTGHWCSMPQGVFAIRTSPTILMCIMREAQRLTIPGTGVLLTAFAAAWLQFTGRTFPVLTWLLILGMILALLWAFNELANWQAEAAEKRVLFHTDEFLADLARMDLDTSHPALTNSHGPTRVLMGELWTPDLEADWVETKSDDGVPTVPATVPGAVRQD